MIRVMKFLVCTIGALLVTAASATSEAASQHVRVIWHDAPSTTAYVAWSTAGPATTRVVWDSAEGASASAYANQAYPARSGPFDDDDAPYFHHAHLQGLPPASRVHFRIVVDESESRDYWFWTAPADARPFVLLYGGDSRSDRAMRRTMHERMRDLVESDPSTLAVIHGGDYVYRGSSWSLWDQWLEDWQKTITSDDRVLPIIPARGNHEGDAALYNKVFAFPGQDDDYGDWFATRIGEDFLLLNLDSNVSQAGEQRRWLEEQLVQGQKYRWIAVNYHRPAYPAVKSPGGALHHWVPLFEHYNVDVVLESDGHVLKRTVPIRDGQFDPSGVVYVGEGGLGVPQREPDLGRWYIQPPGFAMAAHHLQALRVTPDAIYYAAILADGSVADTYRFKPHRRGQYEEPLVESVRMLGPQEIEVVFSRPVSTESAENLANYVMRPGAAIERVEYAPQRQIAVLRAAEPVHGAHRVVVDGVVDLAGKAIPRTVYGLPLDRTTEFPVDGKLEQRVGPTPTAQITVRPIGEPRPPPTTPPIFTCQTASGSGGFGPFVLLLALLVGRGRPQKVERQRHAPVR